MNIVLIFLLKVFDTMLNTSKTLFIQRNFKLFASLTVGLSQYLFLTIIGNAIRGGENFMLLSFAGAVGCYLSLLVSDKLSKDKQWTTIVTSNNKKRIRSLAKKLQKNKLKHVVSLGMDKDFDYTFVITVFTHTKDEQRVLNSLLEGNKEFFVRKV